ncbi:hypothetical protein OG369_42230 [Streptomyces sp. NBC_01221]|uniref:hypothetical protein n=1 Tax=unclassified Streptomyces TaxID=2593676 RepID=UPI002258BC2B|nr:MULTISPECIES: hypothetical protein [unclassified Streptomyces]MCX4792404.1 hypothetical protein [Streptomyces sp. NBC_01221]MCX4799860.1 hypothetical protein [Streptomyces sp. NBC_01242]WSJ41378.1 hypothetical protein OG772_37060 [Streptomyces sp. NBC_01321]WSP67822.1 hypothetical protein OG466_39345 [Streptomyces sp. NBC_01240]
MVQRSDGIRRGLEFVAQQRLEEAGEEANTEIVVPPDGGRARLSVDRLGTLGEPESLTALKKATPAMLPRIDLPDLLFEVYAWTTRIA